MSDVTSTTWHLSPHDPLVLGTGKRPAATLPLMTHALPLPGTLAGAVRARFVGGANDVGPEEARRLLEEVEVRGPWLQRGDTALVRAPLHIRIHGPAPARRVVYPTLEALADGEGVLLPDGIPALRPLLWAPGPGAHKLAAPDELVSLDTACDLLLEERAALAPPEEIVAFEGRVHVTVNATSQTAEPAALYSSPGVRYGDEIAIGVEVRCARERAMPAERLFVLGGEGRVVARRDGRGLPGFDAVRERYVRARARRPGDAPGLLLMLVTPASFSTTEGDTGPGWAPPWLLRDGRVDGLDGARFELAAVATERFVPMSSWSLGHRANDRVLGVQRAVRRLVPAGTVYFLRVDGDSDAWLRACERFWWRPIDETTPGNPGALLAAPHRDGYGIVIPGLFWPDARKEKA